MPIKGLALQKIKSEEDDAELSLRSYDILNYPADFTLELLVEKWKKGEVRNEGFQRKYVWPKERASKLIESFLLGLPVPPIYLYEERGTGKKLIVDGHQRLKSIVYFFSGWFGDPEVPEDKATTFNLIGLDERSPYADKTFQSLAEIDPEASVKLKDAVLRSIIMKQIDPDDDTSIFEIFSRFNTGGMALMPQEIRNCIFWGDFNDLLKSLNKDDAWRQITGASIEDKRMRDIELILRFLALNYYEAYKKPMKNYLNDFMGKYRYPTKSRAQTFEASFSETSKQVLRCLGTKPFHILRGLNAAVFDAVFTAFHRNIQQAKVAKAPAMHTKYMALLGDKDFHELTSSATTDDDVVRKRLNKASEILFG